MTDKDAKTKRKRVYQVAKEFHISNEALIDFLKAENIKVRNHMTPVSDEMYQKACEHFELKDTDTGKEPDFRKRLKEKKEEEEARREVIRHEIDEILERSKGSEFEIVEVIPRVDVQPVGKDKKKKQGETKKESDITKDEKKHLDKVIRTIDLDKVDRVSKKKSVKDKKEAVAEKKEMVAEDKSEDKNKTDEKKRHLKHTPKVEEKGKEENGDKTGKSGKRRLKRSKVEEAQAGQDKDRQARHKKKRRRRKKQVIQIDENEIKASIKETLAKMTETTTKRRRKKKDITDDELLQEEENVIQTTEFTSVAELANLMDVESSEVIQASMSLGLLVTINQRLDKETILMVADEFGYGVKFLTEYGEERVEDIETEEEEDDSLLEPRPPVVTIMGHVDHGKTSLLDYIRESNIIAGESGGITQHIGAYEVSFKNKMITFLDTPGHEAFTAMRARGVQATDIVVLVVAADDSVMPQTVEAINHARAAGVPIVVAINKIDKTTANVDSIKKQLSEKNVLVEDWGGKVQCAAISAKTGEGIDHLLEVILLEAEILELKANPNAKAKAVIIETRMDRGRGIVCTVLVQKGTLRIQDSFVAGQFNGRVRAMFDERDRPIDEAPPSAPVQVLGFNGMPQAGDVLAKVDSEQVAREICMKRQQLKREQGFRQVKRLTLDQISQRIAEGEVRELSIILKADVDGSLEALSDSLMELATEDVAVKIIHKSVGNITESDVILAEASQAVIIGFHVTPNPQAQEQATKEKIDIRLYKVIYDVVNDIKLALSGLLEPEINEEITGELEIRDIFKASKIGLIAGCYVQSGKIHRSNLARLSRDGEVIYEGKISTLKRFKDDVKEVATGYECGVTLENYKDLQVGDIIEAYQLIETARTL